MQALNLNHVQEVAKPELISAVLNPAAGQEVNTDQRQDATDAQKRQSFNRFLEAYSDCV